jgi:hypothetical protein
MTSVLPRWGLGFREMVQRARAAWKASDKLTPFLCPNCLTERTDFLTGRLTGANGTWTGKATLRCKACGHRWIWRG